MVLVGCAVGVILLIHGEPIEDVGGGVALVAIGILAIAAPVDLIRSYASRGFEVEAFGIRAKLPAVHSEPLEDDDAPAHDLMELRFKFEQKMAYLAKHVLGTPHQPACLTLGSMVYDGQLEQAQAQVCAAVSSLRIATATDRERGESLNDWLVKAQRIVSNLRADVLSHTTYTRLAAAEADGERLFHLEREIGIAKVPRAIRVTLARGTGREIIVIPVFSRPPTGRIYKRMASRVEHLQRPILFVCPPRPSLGFDDKRARNSVVRLPGVVEEVSRRLGSEGS